jgi:hypothetical protein|tara:strand:+ start:52 stop:753 length:702 start_codon:yes stop_codon:yes gene_type:complete
MEFVKGDLSIITGDFGKRYIIDFGDLIQHEKYLGDVLSKPKITRRNNEIYEVSFKGKLNSNPSQKAVNASNMLKEKLKRSLNELEPLKDNDLGAKQAYLVLSNFEKRWLEPDNISIDGEKIFINIWGIQPSKLPDVVIIEDPIRPDEENNKNNSWLWLTLLMIIFFGSLYVFEFKKPKSPDQKKLVTENRSNKDDGVNKTKKTKIPVKKKPLSIRSVQLLKIKKMEKHLMIWT